VQDVLENGTIQHFMTRALTLISMHVQVTRGRDCFGDVGILSRNGSSRNTSRPLQGNHNIDLTAALAPAPAVSSTGIWQHVGREAAGRPTHAVVANAAPAKKQPPPPPDNEPSFVEQVGERAVQQCDVGS
jgi:hypothetical protein